MKYPTFPSKLLLFFCFLSITAAAMAQSTWTEKSAAKWVHKGKWKNGLNLKVHPSVNNVMFAEQYAKNKGAWDKAFAFLRDSDLSALTVGKHVIDGDNVYALVTEAPSKEFDKSAWESHKNYIDLQHVITGEEKIGEAPVATATVTKPYDAAKDLANYATEGKFYLATPDIFFLFFPGEAHRPNIKVAGYDVVKKVVVKIRFVN